ncbi:MAG TPA: hypothetical protein VMU16_15455 [Candidatus Binataceae bacterium]|nr:hypothetical protein [Candidatus Binataceae bacterium]
MKKSFFWLLYVLVSSAGPAQAAIIYESAGGPATGSPIVASAPFLWTASTAMSIGNQIVDSNNNMQQVTAVTGDATTDGSAPSWATSIGANTTDHNVTWTVTQNPATNGVETGDLLVAFVGYGYLGQSGGAITGPTGWTKVLDAADGTPSGFDWVHGTVWVKLATASEPSTYSFSTTYQGYGRIMDFRGTSASSPTDTGSVNDNTGTALAALSVNPTFANDMSLACYYAAPNNASFGAPPGSFTPAFVDLLGPFGGGACFYRLLPTRSATGDQPMTISVGQYWAAFQLLLEDAVPVGSATGLIIRDAD